jgi:hypothetical protein
MQHREYIAANPRRAGLADSAEEYPYCFLYLAKKKAAGAKASGVSDGDGTAEAVP